MIAFHINFYICVACIFDLGKFTLCSIKFCDTFSPTSVQFNRDLLTWYDFTLDSIVFTFVIFHLVL